MDIDGLHVSEPVDVAAQSVANTGNGVATVSSGSGRSNAAGPGSRSGVGQRPTSCPDSSQSAAAVAGSTA